MAAYPRTYQTLEPNDLSLDLLTALASLSPAQREAWIDRHIRGIRISNSQRSYIHAAQKRLRAALAGVL